MSCNIRDFLIEQEIICIRIARTCHDNDRIEWNKCAEVLEQRRTDHGQSCPRCKSEDKDGVQTLSH
jgi:hypothetical protein